MWDVSLTHTLAGSVELDDLEDSSCGQKMVAECSRILCLFKQRGESMAVLSPTVDTQTTAVPGAGVDRSSEARDLDAVLWLRIL